jgi:uncharacterized protein (DUF952 family)
LPAPLRYGPLAMGRDDETILHITTAAAWAKAREDGELTTPSLADEGFIHCSTFAQVESTADRIFAGSGELLALEVEVARLTSPLKWERATDVGDEFPHIYGPLNVDAVTGTRPLTESADGYRLG